MFLSIIKYRKTSLTAGLCHTVNESTYCVSGDWLLELHRRYASLACRPAECEYTVDYRVARPNNANVPVQTHFINGTRRSTPERWTASIRPTSTHTAGRPFDCGYAQYRACNVDRTVALYDLCFRCDSYCGSCGCGCGTQTLHIGQQVNAGSVHQTLFQPDKVGAPDLTHLAHYHQVTLSADDGFFYHVSLNRD